MAALLLGAAGAQQAAPLQRVAPAYEGTRARALQVAAERIPLRIGGWRGRDLGALDDLTLKLVAPDAYVNREYVGADGLPAYLAVVYGHRKTSFHSPGFCLLGGGWNIVAKSRFKLRLAGSPASRGRAPFAVNQFVLMRQGRQAVVLYYYVAGKRTTPSWVAHQAYLAWDRLRGQAAAGALVRLTVPARPTADADVQRGAELLALLHPHVAEVVMEGRSSVQ
jgi:EpsI family protein